MNRQKSKRQPEALREWPRTLPKPFAKPQCGACPGFPYWRLLGEANPGKLKLVQVVGLSFLGGRIILDFPTMRLKASDSIHGIPILDIRKLLRNWEGCFTQDHVSDFLELEKSTGNSAFQYLLENGLVEFDSKSGKREFYKRTLKGSAFALAKASRPIGRATAEKALKDFIERVEIVNSNPDYLYKVVKVVLFGSYLSNASTLGDVDLAVELVRKEEDSKKFEALSKARFNLARSKGRRFSTIIDRLFWPYTETLLFLKSRSRSISLHRADDQVLENCEKEIIFQS